MTLGSLDKMLHLIPSAVLWSCEFQGRGCGQTALGGILLSGTVRPIERLCSPLLHTRACAQSILSSSSLHQSSPCPPVPLPPSSCPLDRAHERSESSFDTASRHVTYRPPTPAPVPAGPCAALTAGGLPAPMRPTPSPTEGHRPLSPVLAAQTRWPSLCTGPGTAPICVGARWVLPSPGRPLSACSCSSASPGLPVTTASQGVSCSPCGPGTTLRQVPVGVPEQTCGLTPSCCFWSPVPP